MSKEFNRKELLSLLSFVLDNLDDGNEWRVVQDPVSLLHGWDTFPCLPNGHRKPLISVIYQIAVLVARTGKLNSLPSNPFVVIVSPLKTLISDQLESCQTLKLKAVNTKLELFDNDDKLKELGVWLKGVIFVAHYEYRVMARSLSSGACSI